LIVNELVVNALKHAFPGGRGGEIRIRLEGADDQTLVLEVSDDGIGWPPEMKTQQFDSLGLTLVEVLTRQLRGRIEILRGSGAGVRITFKNVLPPGRRPVLQPR
jgi:two-component sensor histidine kinase